jgi:hypothetical protein
MNTTSTVILRKRHAFLARLLAVTLVFGFVPVLASFSPASAGTASQLAVTTQPAGASNGAAFSTPPVVTVEDSGSLPVTGYSATITATLVGVGTLTNATATVDTATGTATFSALTVTAATGSYSLSFTSSPVLTTVVSNSFTLSAGAATKLAIITQPGGASSGLAMTIQPLVAVEDSGGNIIMNATGTVNAAVTTGTGSLTNASVSIVSGEAVYSNLVLTGVASAVNKFVLTFYATGVTGLATATSALFVLAPGNPTQLAITQGLPTNLTSGTAMPSSGAGELAVSVEDSYGNVVTATPNRTVTISIASGNGSLSILNETSALGIAKFPSLVVTATTPGPFTLLFQAPGVTSVTSPAIQVAGVATQLVLTTQPAGAVSGANLATQPVVTVEDASGNLVTSATGTVTAAISSGPGTLGGTLTATITSGVATFTTLKITDVLGGPYKLTFSATGLTSALSNTFAVIGTASGLAISTQPAGATNGSALTTQPVINVVDASGDIVTAYVGTVAAVLTSGGGSLIGTTSVTVTNGVATFAGLGVSGATSGVTLGFLATGFPMVTSSTVSVAGAATKLVLTTPPSGVVSGSAFTIQPVVAVQDSNGNVVTGYSGTVTATLASGSGTLANATATVTNGVATFSGLSFTGTGTFSLTFASSGLTSAQSGSLSQSGGATKLVLFSSPAGVVSGSAFTTQPVLKVEDASGNVVTSYSGTVTATLGSGSGTLSNYTATITNGVATFSGLSFTGSGTFSITFASSGLTSAQSGSLSQSGTGTRLVVLTQPSGAVNGYALITQPVIAVEDAYGNVVTSYSGTLSASIDYGSGTLTNYTASIINGVATFSGISITGTAGNIALYFQGAGVTAAASSVFTLSVGPATQLEVAAPFMTSSQSGVNPKSPPIVRIEDVGGNVITNYTGTVTASLVSGTGVLSGATAPLVNGVATFSALSLTGSIGSYQLRFIVGPFMSSSTLTLVLTGAPAKLVFGVAPSASAPSDATLNAQPVLNVVDASGYLVTTASGTVEVTMSPSSGKVVNATASVVNGVATFSGLALDAKVGAYTLVFKSSIVATSLSAQVQVLVGSPTRLVVVTPPSQNTVSGQTLTVQPVLQLEDAYGNVVPTSGLAQVDVTNASPASASGAATTIEHNKATLNNGVIRFSGLTLSGNSGPVKVTFSAGGLQTTTTLIIRTSSFFAPLRVNFAPGGTYLTPAVVHQILGFAARMKTVPRIVVVGYAPYQVPLALFRAREVAALLATRMKATLVIRYDTLTRLNQTFVGVQ